MCVSFFASLALSPYIFVSFLLCLFLFVSLPLFCPVTVFVFTSLSCSLSLYVSDYLYVFFSLYLFPLFVVSFVSFHLSLSLSLCLWACVSSYSYCPMAWPRELKVWLTMISGVTMGIFMTKLGGTWAVCKIHMWFQLSTSRTRGSHAWGRQNVCWPWHSRWWRLKRKSPRDSETGRGKEMSM